MGASLSARARLRCGVHARDVRACQLRCTALQLPVRTNIYFKYLGMP